MKREEKYLFKLFYLEYKKKKLVPQKLKELRKVLNLTQEEFSLLLDCSASSVSSLELGNVEPDFFKRIVIEKLHKIFCEKPLTLQLTKEIREEIDKIKKRKVEDLDSWRDRILTLVYLSFLIGGEN